MKLDREDIIVDELVTDVRESCDSSSVKTKKVREKRFFLSPREKVRKYFKNAANEHCHRRCKSRDQTQLSYKPSGECSSAAKVPELSEIYDRARYSDEEITEQDALKMKQIYDRLCDS